MKNRFFTPVVRMVLLGLTLLAAVVWLQLQHLAVPVHQNALLALVLLGYLGFWMARGHRS